MTPERYARAVALVESMLDLESSEWEAALGRAEESDPGIRKLAARLLQASQHSTGFLEEPVAGRCLAVLSEESEKVPVPETNGADPYGLIGKVLDGTYVIEGLVGRGGMGAVYRARHSRLPMKQVAIKVVPQDLRDRLAIEGSAGCVISHPAVVAVTDFNTLDTGELYLAMEYVNGESLRELLVRKKRLALSEAIRIARQVASALDAAHEAGFVHRDIKPDNILIERPDTTNPRVRVIDFGIAKRLDGEPGSELTGDGTLLGTMAYMSPEQLGYQCSDGDPAIDGRTDVYSLAVVFFETVAGHRPIAGRDMWEMRDRIVSGAHMRLGDVVPGVPSYVSAAVARALSVDRASRQRHARGFVTDLDHDERLMDQFDLRMEPSAERAYRRNDTCGSGAIEPPAERPVPPLMSPLERMDVDTGRGIATIEFMHGDLTAMPRDWEVDILVVSAFPGTYAPLHGTLIRALAIRGLDVGALSRDRDESFGELPSCWLSQPLDAYSSTLPVRRILCFEIPWRMDQGESFGHVFLSLARIVNGQPRPATVGMPIIAAGQQRASVSHVARTLVQEAVRALRGGLNVGRLVVAEQDAHKAGELRRAIRAAHELPDT